MRQQFRRRRDEDLIRALRLPARGTLQFPEQARRGNINAHRVHTVFAAQIEWRQRAVRGQRHRAKHRRKEYGDVFSKLGWRVHFVRLAATFYHATTNPSTREDYLTADYADYTDGKVLNPRYLRNPQSNPVASSSGFNEQKVIPIHRESIGFGCCVR